MRVFIAIEIPAEIRERLTSVQNDLRADAGAARWVPAESVHLTLKFLGEIRLQKVEIVDSALADLSWGHFPVSIQGLGFFPGTRSPRVLWAGLRAPTMEGLAQELDARLERVGFEKEKRAFRPHITLARAKTSRLDGALVKAADRFAQTDFGSFIVDRCFLYQSALKPTGSVYTKLKEYLL